MPVQLYNPRRWARTDRNGVAAFENLGAVLVVISDGHAFDCVSAKANILAA